MDTSTITIQEKSGFKRVLDLSGSALPFKPAEWASKLNVKTTWYVGNDRASQQVLGPQDPPSKWNGRWSRVMLGRTPVVYTDETGESQYLNQPLDVVSAVETIQRQGSLLRVIWCANNGSEVSIVREGRLVDFVLKIHTPYDIEWEMNFDWQGRETSQGQRVAATRVDNTVDAVSLQTAMGNFLTGVTGLNIGIGPILGTQVASVFNPGAAFGLGLGLSYALSTIGVYENLSSELASAVLDFVNAISANQTNLNTLQEVYTTEGNQTFATSNTFADFAADTAAQTNDQMQSMGQTPIELMSNGTTASDITIAATAFGQVWGFMVRLQGNAKDMELNARVAQSTNPGGSIPTTSTNPGSPLKATGIMTTHQVRRRETVIDISMRYYQSPDFVMNILKANHLPWWTVDLTPGKILVIPNQPTQQGGVNA